MDLKIKHHIGTTPAVILHTETRHLVSNFTYGYSILLKTFYELENILNAINKIVVVYLSTAFV